MEVETKFLRLFKPVAWGDRIDDWRVCWVGRLGPREGIVCRDGES
jgi:hypothetical protein